MTKDKYGRQMCGECASKAKAEMEAREAEKKAKEEPKAEPADDLAAQLMEE